MEEFVLQKTAELGLENFISVVDFFYKILLCIITLAIGHLVLKFFTRLLKKALRKSSNIEKSETILTVCSSVLKYFLYIFVLPAKCF